MAAGLVLPGTDQARAEALSQSQAAKVAQQITVRIEGAIQGSGVLIERQGSTYTVLTAWHVVSENRQGESIDVITGDGRVHSIEIRSIRRISNTDLAALEFTSNANYAIATLGAADKTPRKSRLVVAGYPNEADSIYVTTGFLYAAAKRQREGGYELVYSNETAAGMSGGAVVDEAGQLIGIHGRSEELMHTESMSASPLKAGINLGMPISHYTSLGNGESRPDMSEPTTIDDLIAEWQIRAISALEPGDHEAMKSIAKQALGLERSVETECMHASSISSVTRTAAGPGYQEMLEAFRRVLLHQPRTAGDFGCRATAHMVLGNTNEVVAEYSRGIAADPEAKWLYHSRGAHWYGVAIQAKIHNKREAALNAYNNALADYNRAIALEKFTNIYPTGLMMRAALFSLFDQHKAAIQDQDMVLRLLPLDPGAHITMAQFKAKTGDVSGACQSLQRSRELLLGHTNKTKSYGSESMIQNLLKQYNCDKPLPSSQADG